MHLQTRISFFSRCGVSAAIALLSACGGSDPSGTDVAASSNPAQVTCGDDAFPCSLDKVSLTVLEQGERLADLAVARLARGEAITDVLGFVNAQAGVADAAGGAAALRFRLVGGRDVVILVPAARQGALPAVALNTAVAAPSGRVTAQFVVGPRPTEKRALVLSPFKYFFAPDDDGAAVAQLLQDSRGYAGQVSYQENASKTSAAVGIQQFLGWDAFDVIHVTSHGGRVCDASRCVSVILSGDIY